MFNTTLLRGCVFQANVAKLSYLNKKPQQATFFSEVGGGASAGMISSTATASVVICGTGVAPFTFSTCAGGDGGGGLSSFFVSFRFSSLSA